MVAIVVEARWILFFVIQDIVSFQHGFVPYGLIGDDSEIDQMDVLNENNNLDCEETEMGEAREGGTCKVKSPFPSYTRGAPSVSTAVVIVYK